ncbi:hypothetical protein PVIIG_06334 [Plasmodium vivax India VII]|uniref:VIR protein n=1 Tax=Plasmodium vivax India VII TaxID=1077284 RepID=A0A0J9S1P9_PLAVI|nr:hypothetical protein PVIIG_06334 [Plasmodium vivax India VII]
MTILDIFNDNMHNIITKLMDEPEKDKFSAKNFVCESVNIYKEMYKHYCNDPRARDTENKKTCDHLNIIKTIYNQYLLKKQVLKNKIPSLDGSDKEFWDKCKADEKLSEIPVVRVPEAPRMQYLDEGSGEDIPQEMPYKEDYDENKFSPARRLVHSRFRGNTGRMNSNLYGNEPNELLFDGFQGEDMSSLNTRYNIGYGSV